MNEEQQAIWNYLRQNARGYENRRSSSEIRDSLNLPSGGPTNEHVRFSITDMILNHGCCFGSLMWASGYWIIQNEDELNRVCESLENRAESIVARADAIRQNFQNRNQH